MWHQVHEKGDGTDHVLSTLQLLLVDHRHCIQKVSELQDTQVMCLNARAQRCRPVVLHCAC